MAITVCVLKRQEDGQPCKTVGHRKMSPADPGSTEAGREKGERRGSKLERAGERRGRERPHGNVMSAHICNRFEYFLYIYMIYQNPC